MCKEDNARRLNDEKIAPLVKDCDFTSLFIILFLEEVSSNAVNLRLKTNDTRFIDFCVTFVEVHNLAGEPDFKCA